MAKTFNQLATNFTTLSKDDSAANLALGKTLINICIKKILGLADFTFHRGSQEYTSIAAQQYYELPYNCGKARFLKAEYGDVVYRPTEVRNLNSWLALNRVSVSGDIPQKYFVDEITRRFGVYPIVGSTDVTYALYFQKKIIDLSATDHTTGTVTTTANSSTIEGAGTPAWTASMAGRFIKITDTTSVLNGIWFEIESVTDTDTLVVKENIPVAVSGKSYTIAEMIPFPDGFEDIPLWFALWQYFLSAEDATQASHYKQMYKDDIQDLLRRDSKSVSGIITPDKTLDNLVDINDYPQTIS